MQKSLMVFGAGALMIFAAGGVLHAQKEPSSKASAHKRVVYVSASSAEFKPGPTKGVSMAVLRGDANKGAYEEFTKFDPGYDAGLHTHTNDVWIVGIKGAYLYKDDDGEKRVGPGDFLLVPGGHKHWSGGDKAEGALFYTAGSAKFDLVPAK
jgi:quercetin dioxygenase-like cupin family protein